jgi:DNA-directed RNA polymerase subunit RPC12/RpoP
MPKIYYCNKCQKNWTYGSQEDKIRLQKEFSGDDFELILFSGLSGEKIKLSGAILSGGVVEYICPTCRKELPRYFKCENCGNKWAIVKTKAELSKHKTGNLTKIYIMETKEYTNHLFNGMEIPVCVCEECLTKNITKLASYGDIIIIQPTFKLPDAKPVSESMIKTLKEKYHFNLPNEARTRFYLSTMNHHIIKVEIPEKQRITFSDPNGRIVAIQNPPTKECYFAIKWRRIPIPNGIKIADDPKNLEELKKLKNQLKKK